MTYADNPKLWRERAEEARVKAEQMMNEVARSGMLRVAESYEHIARHAEERIARHKKS